MDKKAEFLDQLAKLLSDYNVNIVADVSEGSDTHGIFGRNIQILHKEPSTFKQTCWLYTDEWTLDSQEINELLGF